MDRKELEPQSDQGEDLVRFAMAKRAVERFTLPRVSRFMAMMLRKAESESDRLLLDRLKDEHPNDIADVLLENTDAGRRLREIAPYQVFLTSDEMTDISKNTARAQGQTNHRLTDKQRAEIIERMRENRLRRRLDPGSLQTREPKILEIPRTTPERYISGIVALNIPRPESTGDWHQTQIFFTPRATMPRTFVVERGQPNDPTRFFGNEGIYDASTALDALGVQHPDGPVYAADHARAIADLVVVSILNGKAAEFVNLDGWMPRDEDKFQVLRLLERTSTALQSQQKELLDFWKQKNFKVEEVTHGRIR